MRTYELTCTVCGCTYTAFNPSGKYCSENCRKIGLVRQGKKPWSLGVAEQELREVRRAQAAREKAHQKFLASLPLDMAKRIRSRDARTGSIVETRGHNPGWCGTGR